MATVCRLLIRGRFVQSTNQRSFASLREKAKKINPKELYEPMVKDRQEYPEYDFVNIRLQSYDYAPLEKFQSFVHRTANRFGFEVVDSYAVPAQTEMVVLYKPVSTIVDTDFELKLFDRWVRLKNVPAIRLPLFSTLLRTHAPVGTQITIKEHGKADEDYRYVTNLALKEKQEELKSLDDINVRRALGWE
ncbi:39S ribosomal protein L48, mitochondrial [Aphelenchoides besseyi]|nr:39S ribosomal protein L48, mitochondrial [Aphelenchoides besseyi]